MRTFAAHPSSLARRSAIVALLVVVVLAQTLGWIHRSLHGSPSQVARPASTHAMDAAAGATFAVQDLFGSHAESSDCRLFDVLGQPGCPAPPLLFLPVSAPAAALAVTHAEFVARRAALFDARGPPVSR